MLVTEHFVYACIKNHVALALSQAAARIKLDECSASTQLAQMKRDLLLRLTWEVCKITAHSLNAVMYRPVTVVPQAKLQLISLLEASKPQAGTLEFATPSPSSFNNRQHLA